jgi:GTP diphosphokinase / guanosine-3',5'-bis(diphosphate) 3'-diphosphatase
MAKRKHDGSTGLVLKALAFAAHKHRHQRRKDIKESAYIGHPIALAEVLWNEGKVRDAVTLAAALLHDTVEDTETTLRELRGQFGDEIAATVEELTDVKWLGKRSRKLLQVARAGRAGRRARLVKLADKICNLRDVIAQPPAGWSRDRKREYFDWARKVVDQVRGTHPVLERRFDAVYARRP